MNDVFVTCIKNGRFDMFGRPLVSGSSYTLSWSLARDLWLSGYVSVTDASVFDSSSVDVRRPNLAAELAAIGISSGGSVTAQSLGDLIAGATAKTTPANADNLVLADSAAGNISKKISFTNFAAWVKSIFVSGTTSYLLEGSDVLVAHIKNTSSGGSTKHALKVETACPASKTARAFQVSTVVNSQTLMVYADSGIGYQGPGFGFGVLTPNAAALVQIDSTTQGFLPPRMTTTQRNAIATPPEGLTVWDTTLKTLASYNGTSWQVFTIS